MRHVPRIGLAAALVVALALAAVGVWFIQAKLRAPPQKPLLLLVADPLARELACACVPGFGQRDYRRLARHLEDALRCQVAIEFADDVADSLGRLPAGPDLVVIGERSVTASAAANAGRSLQPLAELTGLDGTATVSAVVTARRDDPAASLAELAGRTILVGLSGADAAQSAFAEGLVEAGLNPTPQLVQRGYDAKVGLDVLDSAATPPPVAVMPEYVLRLLEGCGSITPGSLKVIGRTAPQPFVTVFTDPTMLPERVTNLREALLGLDDTLRQALESRDGFRTAAPAASAAPDWPDWRGPGRDGRVPKLPSRLPDAVTLVWKRAAMPDGLAGLSAAEGRVILAERDLADESDVYRCLDADTGETVWRAEFAAPGRLDYGQSPRATPVLHGGRAYLLGAFGELRCVDLADGRLRWRRNLIGEFHGTLPPWGTCSTPLIVDGLVIVNPGAPTAGVAALDADTGQTRWTSPGTQAAYASFIVVDAGGGRQLVGLDAQSAGGWDPRTGKRLWERRPARSGDFNVPTPVHAGGALIFSAESNGTRLYRFGPDGIPAAQPDAVFANLAPDTMTPVATAGRLFGVHDGLHCLDLARGLAPVWHWDDPALGDYATLLADDERVLLITAAGELVLFDARADQPVVLSRLLVLPDEADVYCHPALAGSRLYLRGASLVLCVDLSPQSDRTHSLP
ncbi:MAG: PQQ-binding-like beta-propeller repeat protein [Verrucomicrobiae bacterium]|nr:PQQ-binding-like beta-propeller repeat protein [Verrucomicrobiae bacterium]